MLNRYFSIYLAAHLVPAAIGFFAITAFTRLLNPAEYGVYVVGMSIAGILGAVFFAWIRLSVSRYQATSASVDFRGTAIMAFGLTVLALCSIAPLALLFHRGVSVNLLIASIFVAISVNAVEIGWDFERASLRPYRFAAIAMMHGIVLEWAWRIWLEPRRLFWRYFTTNPRALYLLFNKSRPSGTGRRRRG